MNVNVLHGVVMDDTLLLVQEIKVYGYGKVIPPTAERALGEKVNYSG